MKEKPGTRQSLCQLRVSRYVLPALAYLLGLVFLAAGVSKVFTFGSFVTAVGAYGIFPRDWIPFLAGVLIVVEIGLGVFLFLHRTQGLAGGVASAMLTFFIALGIYAKLSGLQGDCGCFEFARSEIGGVQHLLIDGVLWVISQIIFWRNG